MISTPILINVFWSHTYILWIVDGGYNFTVYDSPPNLLPKKHAYPIYVSGIYFGFSGQFMRWNRIFMECIMASALFRCDKRVSSIPNTQLND